MLKSRQKLVTAKSPMHAHALSVHVQSALLPTTDAAPVFFIFRWQFICSWQFSQRFDHSWSLICHVLSRLDLRHCHLRWQSI